MDPRNVAYSAIKQRRRNTIVDKGPGGRLCDYVPFYFGTKSPMLYTYKNGNVTGRRESQDEIIYLVSAAEDIAAAGLPFVFSDGHPVVEPRSFYDSLARLSEVDLPLMTATWWFDTNDDPDRKRRRQAEFLVHDLFPWTSVVEVGVRTAAMRDFARDLIARVEHQPPCNVHHDWYYSD